MVNIHNYRAQIEAALKYSGGTHTFNDVVAMVAEGRAQMWVNGDSIAITEIIVYPRKRCLHCFLAGGTAKGIIEMMDDAAAWGKAQGCSSFTISGRKGWQRVLRKHGWRPVMIVMEAAL